MRTLSPLRQDVLPSRTRDPEGGRYADIPHLVYELNKDISPPAPRVDDTFSGKLFSRYQGNTKEDKTPVLPLSGVMENADRNVTGVVTGVSRSPLAEEQGRMLNVGVPTSAFRLRLSGSSSRTTIGSPTQMTSRKMRGYILIRTGRQLLPLRY